MNRETLRVSHRYRLRNGQTATITEIRNGLVTTNVPVSTPENPNRAEFSMGMDMFAGEVVMELGYSDSW